MTRKTVRGSTPNCGHEVDNGGGYEVATVICMPLAAAKRMQITVVTFVAIYRRDVGRDFGHDVGQDRVPNSWLFRCDVSMSMQPNLFTQMTSNKCFPSKYVVLVVHVCCSTF